MVAAIALVSGVLSVGVPAAGAGPATAVDPAEATTDTTSPDGAEPGDGAPPPTDPATGLPLTTDPATGLPVDADPDASNGGEGQDGDGQDPTGHDGDGGQDGSGEPGDGGAGQDGTDGGQGPMTTVPADGAGTAEGDPDPDDTSEPTDADADTTDTSADPLVDEAPGEDAPETDETVPEPDGAYAGQAEFKPAEILWSSVRAAEAKLAEANAVRRAVVDDVRRLRLRHKRLRRERESLGDEVAEAAADIEEAETALRSRAVAAFMSDGSLSGAVVGTLQAAEHDRVLTVQVRRRLLDVALGQDEVAIADYLRLRRSLDGEILAKFDDIRHTEQTIRATTADADTALEAIVQAEIELDAFRAGSEIYIDEAVFPIGDGYQVPLIDSFGFPRMPGTPDEHWHEGIDIFAPTGAPLVAAERGVVTRVGSGRLGGLTLWLRGESGADWYYAHLSAHAPGLAEGQLVEAGDLVGYVGNTGNAITTPPHLHMEIHPAGSDPVNPYPLLKAISDRDRAAATAAAAG